MISQSHIEGQTRPLRLRHGAQLSHPLLPKGLLPLLYIDVLRGGGSGAGGVSSESGSDLGTIRLKSRGNGM
jgi:hypothetical protein